MNSDIQEDEDDHNDLFISKSKKWKVDEKRENLHREAGSERRQAAKRRGDCRALRLGSSFTLASRHVVCKSC